MVNIDINLLGLFPIANYSSLSLSLSHTGCFLPLLSNSPEMRLKMSGKQTCVSHIATRRAKTQTLRSVCGT